METILTTPELDRTRAFKLVNSGRFLEEFGLIRLVNTRQRELISSLEIYFDAATGISLVPTIEVNSEEIAFINSVQVILNESRSIALLNIDLNEDIKNPCNPRYSNGLRFPIREKNLFKGASPLVISHLLEKSDSWDNPLAIFLGAYILYSLLSNHLLSQEERRTIAVQILYVYFPLLRFYENSGVMNILVDSAFSYLFPDLYKFAIERKNRFLGFERDEQTLPRLEAELRGAIQSLELSRYSMSSREKSAYSFFLKLMEGASPYDSMGAKSEVDMRYYSDDATRREYLYKIVAKLESMGIRIIRITDTYTKPFQFNKDYKVLNIRAEIPLRLLGREPGDLYIPVEIRLSSHDNIPQHTKYKVTVQSKAHLTVDPEVVAMIEEYLKSRVSLSLLDEDVRKVVESSNNFKESTQQISRFRQNLQGRIMLFTGKANHAIFVERGKSLGSQLNVFSMQVVQSSIKRAAFILKRVQEGKIVRYKITIKDNDIAIVMLTDGEYTIPVDADTFELEDRDMLVRINEDSSEYLTINDVLNLIALSEDENSIPFDLIFRYYTNIDCEYIKHIYRRLRSYNNWSPLDKEGNLLPMNEELFELIKDAHKGFIKQVRLRFVRISDIDECFSLNEKPSSDLRSHYKDMFLGIEDSSLQDEICKRDNLGSVLDRIFILDNLSDDPKSWKNWFKTLIHFKKWKNKRVYEYLLNKMKVYLMGKSTLSPNSLDGIICIYAIESLDEVSALDWDNTAEIFDRYYNGSKDQFFEYLTSRYVANPLEFLRLIKYISEDTIISPVLKQCLQNINTNIALAIVLSNLVYSNSIRLAISLFQGLYKDGEIELLRNLEDRLSSITKSSEGIPARKASVLNLLNEVRRFINQEKELSAEQ